MKVKLWIKLFSLVSFFFVLFCAIGIKLLTTPVNAEPLTETNILSTEIFQPSNVNVSAHSISSGVDEYGLKLSFESEGDSIKLKENIIGNFSIEYVQAIEAGFNPIEELQFIFTDVENGNNFIVSVEQNNLSYNVHVVFQNENLGIYRFDNKEKGFTYLYNRDGLFTNLLGNKAVVSFDADTKCVYFGNGVESLLVWDLSKSNNDGKDIGCILNDFGAYSVEIVARRIESNRNIAVKNDIIIYSINDVSLSSFFIENNLPNSIYANIEKYGVVGTEYLIPKGYAYNILNGISRDVSVTVKTMHGESVDVYNNKFTPNVVAHDADDENAAGDYILTYSKGGESKEYIISIKKNAPSYIFNFDEPLIFDVEIGQKVYIPQLKVSGGVYIYSVLTAGVTISKDSVELSEYKNVESGFDFVFSETGSYEIKYSLKGEILRSYIIDIEQEYNYIYGSGLKSVYSKNSQIDLTDVCAKFGNDIVQGDISVKIPDGRIISNKKFRLSSEGIYTLIFNTTYNGRDYTLKKSFEVSNLSQDLFSNSDKKLEVSYGASSVTGKSGVKFTASSGGLSFVYNQPIDISKYIGQAKKDENDFVSISSTASPLVEMSIDPISAGVSGALEFTIYIEDAEDSSNRIAINIRYNDDEIGATIKAGATGQVLTGMEWRDAGSASLQYYNGAKFIKRTNRFGFFTYHTFDGTTTDRDGTNAKDSVISIYYDNVEKQILCKPLEEITDENPAGDPWLVCDLDEELLFGNNLWSGFKSDKVILKGQISGLTSTSVDYYIYTVDGVRLDSQKLSYNKAPTIFIKNNEGISLESIVGKSVKVPSASATDMYNKSVDVYATKAFYVKGDILNDIKKYILNHINEDNLDYILNDIIYDDLDDIVDDINNYNLNDILTHIKEDYLNVVLNDIKNDNWIDINISNHTLKTEKAGNYVIRYYAKDSYGNEKLENLLLIVHSSYANISLSIGSEYADYANFEIFDIAKVMPEKYVYVENNIGETVLETKVYNKLPESAIWEDVFVTDNRFSIERTGEYKVVFTVTDSLGRIGTTHYTFTVDKTSDYVVDSKLPAYEAFISGNTYDIFEITILEINSDGTTNKTNADIYIDGEIFDGKTYTAAEIIKALDGYQERTIKLEYKYNNILIKEYDIPILPVLIEEKTIVLNKYERIDTVFHVENYFKVFGNVEFMVNDSYTLLKLLDNESSVTYSYPISANNVQLAFDVDGEKSTTMPLNTNIDYVLITFRDSSNINNYLTVRVFVKGDKTVAKLNDKVDSLENLTGSLLGTSLSTLSIIYDNEKQCFYDGNSRKLLFVVNENALGDTFKGFAEKVYFTISIQSKNDEPVSIRLLNLNNSKFVKMDKDVYNPNIVLDNQILGYYDPEMEIVIPKARAEHIFWDIETLTVSVYNSSTNEYLVSVDGTLLNNVPADRDYVLRVDNSGAYIASYKAVNKVNSVQEVNYLFKVNTNKEVALSINGAVSSSVDKGATIKIPEYSVNYLEESDLNLDYIIMVSPTNAYKLLKSKEDYKFTEIGEYKLRFYAIDGIYGKYALREYRITCK